MDISSFWTDIKKFEDSLAKDPSSYCFAPLAELYRKTGLLDDAIATARKGTALHPEYVGGYMALGRAYMDKEMMAEAREALQRVANFTPENIMAQKLLCHIYTDSGENTLLRKALETLLLLNPDDTESRIQLESLERISAREQQLENRPESGDPGNVDSLEKPGLFDDPEEVDEEILALEEQEFLPYEIEEEYTSEPDAGEKAVSTLGIQTSTIAELYFAQGHPEQALEIYRELIVNAPGNIDYETRIAELEELVSVETHPVTAQLEDHWSEEEITPVQTPSIIEETVTDIPILETEPIDKDDEMLATFQRWMENIRGIRECRSERG